MRFAARHSFLGALFVAVLAVVPEVMAQATGTWEGTFSASEEDCGAEGRTVTYTSPATLPLTQSGNSVTGIIALKELPLFGPDCETVDTTSLSVPLTGQLDGTQFTGSLSSFTGEATVVTGTISGNSLSFTFPEDGATITATRVSTATPSSALSGSYAGSYTAGIKLGDACPNLPELAFSGSLSGPGVQAGSEFAATLLATGTKTLDIDANGNCIVIDSEDVEVLIGGTITGNTFNGTAVGFVIFAEVTGTVSGSTITGSGESEFSRFSFSISRTSAAPAPTISRFDAQPAAIQQGQSTTLSWTTTSADSVTIDNGVGKGPASGSVVVSPATTTTYRLVATGPGGTASRTTTVMVAASAPRIAITSFPNGMIQAAGQATATDQFTVTNLGGTQTTVTLTQNQNFFTQAPTSFPLAGGASQVVTLRATAQQPGSFDGQSIVSGAGSTGIVVPVRLVVAAPPAAPVVPSPDRTRPELAAPADQSPTGTLDFTNSGSGTLQGFITSDASWLVPVTTGLVTIAPGQTQRVTFRSDRTLRPDADALVGGTVARLSLRYLDFATPTGVSASQASSGSTANALSVSIVDVVKPGLGNNTPPPLAAGERAVFAPGLPQRTNSLGDLLLSATTTVPDLRLFFTGAGVPPVSTNLNLAIPNIGVSLPSVLKNVFSTPATSGTVQVRSANADRISIAAVQTNTASRIGSYITALPTFVSDRSVGSGQRLFLAGVEKGGTRLTNLYVQEVSGNSGTVQIDGFDAAGNLTALRPTESVPAFGFIELPDVIPSGITAVRVTNVGASSNIVAYALVVDAATQDAWVVRDSALDGGSTGVIVPVIPGPAMATTQTSLYVFNPGTTPLTVTFDTIRSGGDRRRAARSTSSGNSLRLEANAVTTATIAPRQTLVAQPSAVSSGYVRVSAPAPVSVSARATLTASGRLGSFGSALPPIAPSAALGTGESRRFSGVDDSSQRTIDSRTPVTYRSSLGLLETTGQNATIRLTLRYTFSAGTRTTAQGVSSREVTVAANQFLFLGELSKTIIGAQRESFGDLRNMQLDIEVVGGNGRVIPFVQTIDNGSNDMSVRSE